ncbi:uncharacterized protein LY89DRAFT_662723 [Mollisia scopiformis]|uniref:NACHT domain-containing protein n=1 Tax=Mollisia scopiformis TaxID=149040 RepID=A0A194XUQ8_MOLSC|nr:uncharacterized protein LY89DRAFT_662723 [Mollisia scopiformis]KUJ23943.1 hypothetical protein LY89DRAFT_662723 [Mollisia scopiformis]
MDGLSAAASIIAVIQIAQIVGSELKDYYEGVRQAREEIQKLYNTIKNLEVILERLQELFQLPSSHLSVVDPVFVDQAGPLKQCQEELSKLEAALEISTHRGRIRKSVQSLKWPFEKKDVEKRVVVLERHKSSLALCIGVENLQSFGESLIYYGSTVIDHIQKRSINESNVAVVYWYFTFTNIDKQNVANALCSAIADICGNRRDTPEELQRAHDRCNAGQQKPPFDVLKSMLKVVSNGFDNIYLILDALDECPTTDGQRDTLLEFLHEVSSWQLDCLHVLATSRRELDIQESLTSSHGKSSHFLSVQGSHVEQDIMKYLGHRLEHHTFRSWKPALKQDVKEDLVKKANGMQIREAMNALPRSREALYNRMLQSITDEDQEYAQRAFQWLAFSARPITLEELAEAAIIKPCAERPELLEETRFLDPQDLLHIIPSGLISVITINPYDFDNSMSEEDMIKYIDTLFGDNESMSASANYPSGSDDFHSGDDSSEFVFEAGDLEDPEIR